MASTKAVTAIWSGQNLVAANADTVSSSVDLQDGYGAAIHIKFTNGATGPTLPASCDIETSADDSEFYRFGGRIHGATGNDDIVSWGGIEIPIGVEFIRVVAGRNTGQNVVIDVDISEVTAVS